MNLCTKKRKTLSITNTKCTVVIKEYLSENKRSFIWQKDYSYAIYFDIFAKRVYPLKVIFHFLCDAATEKNNYPSLLYKGANFLDCSACYMYLSR